MIHPVYYLGIILILKSNELNRYQLSIARATMD